MPIRLSGKEIIKALSKDGWAVERIRAGVQPHTVVTVDLEELRAALSPGAVGYSGGSGPGSSGG